MAMRSLVVIAPAEHWQQVQAINLALGYTVSDGVPLEPIGGGEVTHRATLTPADEPYIAIATGQTLPTIEGYTPEQIAGFLSLLTVSVHQAEIDGPVAMTGAEHFDSVAAAAGLQRVVSEI